jgi:serine/threonine protein kinase
MRGWTAAHAPLPHSVGSPYYLSPEVCQDVPYNTKSDVWALGCVLYELCALRPAFGGSNLISVVNKIVNCSYEVRWPPRMDGGDP